jgi:tRNA-splicing ligase RtcB
LDKRVARFPKADFRAPGLMVRGFFMGLENCCRDLRLSTTQTVRITLVIRMEIFDNQIPVFGQADDRTVNQIRVCARTAHKVALMPDNHVGYGVPIGGVVAYKNAISPTGVGYDIGCGNKAVRVDMPGTELRARIAVIMDDVWSIVSFGVGRRNNEQVDHALFDDEAWKLKAISPLKQMARNQLGTVGSGNHYVDLFTDESGTTSMSAAARRN